MIELTRIPVRAADAAVRMVDDEAVIVLQEKSVVIVLNAVGGRIWEAIDGQRSLEQIAGLVCAEFAVEQAEAASDTQSFVEQLLARRAVTLRPADSER